MTLLQSKLSSGAVTAKIFALKEKAKAVGNHNIVCLKKILSNYTYVVITLPRWSIKKAKPRSRIKVNYCK